jgi:dTDP-4-amino-4,6-dideoxygalactose transaminase
MAVPFMDLVRLHKPLKDDLVKAFDDCLSSSDFVLGPSLRKFEENFGKEFNARHSIGVASGTDALLLTLHAIGVAPGDEVIVPAFGFVATVDVVLRLGATVVFVDVKEDMTIDVDAVRAALTERTKAIIPVHLFGLAAEIEALAQIASDYGLYLVEDVAQATGGEISSRSLGTFGIAGAFSFYPTKNLGGLGDGGMVTTESDELAERVRLFRDHGRQDGMTFVTVGYNSRLDSIQAAMLDIKLESLREDNADRVENARFYENNLTKDFFQLPPFREDGSHVYHQYTIRHPHRDELRTFLAERQIESKVYYPSPLHLQPCFEFLGYRQGHFPQAELAASQVLSIPMFPGLTRQELEEVVHTMELYAKTHPVPAAS